MVVKPFLSENEIMLFQLFSGIKEKFVDMMQSHYLCVILHVKRKTLFILTYLF